MSGIILPGDSEESQKRKVFVSKGIPEKDIPVSSEVMIERLSSAVKAMKAQSDKMAVILTALVITHGLRGKLGISVEALKAASDFDGRIAIKKDPEGLIIRIVSDKPDPKNELAAERGEINGDAH